VTLSSFADQTWKGTSDNLWNTTGNWSGGAIPGSTDIVIYNSNSTANLSNQLTTVFSIKGIAFTNPAGPVSINSANTLTTGASGINMTNATQMLTIAAPVALSANQTWVVATNQSLTVSGAVSGSSTIFKDGPGILYLNGANTWTGNVTNNGGQIWINNSAGLGVGSKLIYVAANNVGVHLNGTNGNISLANNISWTASDSAGAIVNEAGNNTVAGPINVFSGGGAPYFVANAGSLTLSGTITLGTTGRPMTLGGAAAGIDTGGINSAALAVQKTDAGTWTLSAHNAYGGITTISNGTLALVSCNSY
jgi:autotransporter-associated beta strand protein